MHFYKLAFASIVMSTINHVNADSIYDIANASSGFGTLVAAVNAAGLSEVLSGDGTFTTFAPVDAAFGKLPEELLTKLLDPIWKPQLQDVLKYHVLGSEVRSTDLSDGLTATTLNGEIITINLDPPRINNSSNILIDQGLVDVEADNGVIHGIDSVLTPASITSNVVDIAVGNDAFSTLVAAVSAAGLVDALSGEGPFTVFAPTNEAFGALPDGTLDSLLLEENVDMLTDILKYHVVPANAASAALTSGPVDTLAGKVVEVDVSSDGVKVNGANVITADIIASNGIIHVVDTVLLPPTDPETTPPPTPVPTGKPTDVTPPATEPDVTPPATEPDATPSSAYGPMTGIMAVTTTLVAAITVSQMF